jgi:hypothetical protein
MQILRLSDGPNAKDAQSACTSGDRVQRILRVAE